MAVLVALVVLIVGVVVGIVLLAGGHTLLGMVLAFAALPIAVGVWTVIGDRRA